MIADYDTPPQAMQLTRFNVNSIGELILNNIVLEENDETQLTPQQIDFRNKVWRFQEINSGDYRVWGSVVNTKEHIRLATEIRYCTDGDNPVQQWVDNLPTIVPVSIGGGITFLPFGTDVMADDIESDSMGVTIDRIETNMHLLIGRTIVERGSEARREGMLWTHGPRHGRPCRHIEIFVDVTSLKNKKQLQAAKDALITMTASVYQDHGVSVI